MMKSQEDSHERNKHFSNKQPGDPSVCQWEEALLCPCSGSGDSVHCAGTADRPGGRDSLHHWYHSGGGQSQGLQHQGRPGLQYCGLGGVCGQPYCWHLDAHANVSKKGISH